VLSDRAEHTKSAVADPALLAALGRPAPDDFYALLRCGAGASFGEVKAAYRALAKAVHPDIVGESATNLLTVLNLAVATLTDERLRQQYDEALAQWRERGSRFSGQAVSAWGAAAEGETDAVFVDECACTGCRRCVDVAPETFGLEDEWGRARVHTQWGNARTSVEEAVDTCPVSVIYYVPRDEVALLEFVMAQCTRESVAMINQRLGGNAGGNAGNDDPFEKAATFIAKRRGAFTGDAAAQLRLRRQDDALAAIIASAWLALPEDLRARVWPEVPQS